MGCARPKIWLPLLYRLLSCASLLAFLRHCILSCLSIFSFWFINPFCLLFLVSTVCFVVQFSWYRMKKGARFKNSARCHNHNTWKQLSLLERMTTLIPAADKFSIKLHYVCQSSWKQNEFCDFPLSHLKPSSVLVSYFYVHYTLATIYKKKTQFRAARVFPSRPTCCVFLIIYSFLPRPFHRHFLSFISRLFPVHHHHPTLCLW